jgi:hypothetical protein
MMAKLIEVGLKFNPRERARDFRFDVPARELKDLRAGVNACFSG